MFDVEGEAPAYDGSVTARPSGATAVTVEAPPITLNATVNLHSDVTLGEAVPVRVGPIQTLLGSERVGVYRRGGTPDGEVTAEQHEQAGQVRDAQWNPGPSGPTAAVEAPWYSAPSSISDSARQAQVHFLDQPGIEFPVSVGEGQLTETRGQDRFTTSIAAKQGDRLVHLRAFNWQVPWNMTIGPEHRGQGGTIIGSGAVTPPPTTDGPIAVAASQGWVAFSTVEEAMGAGNEVLLNNLAPAKAQDQQAWQNIVEALRRKNPTFNVTLTVRSTSSWTGGDELNVHIRGHQEIQRSPGTLNDGQSATMTFGLNDLFDPAAMGAGESIEFRVQRVAVFSNDPPATMSWPYPFAAQSTPAPMAGGGGRYVMTAGFH